MEQTDEQVKNKCGVNLLAIGIDERVFDKASDLYQKTLLYGDKFHSVHIICRSRISRRHEVINNVFFYPIYTRFPFLFSYYALRIGRNIVSKEMARWLVSADNPFEIGFVAWGIARRSGGRLFVQVHTDFVSPWFRRFSWKERVRYWLGRFVVFRADYIRVVSERIKRSLVSQKLLKGGAQLSVLPIAINATLFENAKPLSVLPEYLKNSSYKIIAVGRFVEKEKNFQMAIEAMPAVISQIPDARLVIVGDGPDREYYGKLIKRLNVENHVILEKWRNDLPSFYKAFDVCILTSNYEGWGRVPLEAMAAGLPVVMTNVGLAGEVVKNGENGSVVPVGDRDALISSILELWEDTKLRQEFSRKGLATAKSLSLSPDEYHRKYLEGLVKATHTSL